MNNVSDDKMIVGNIQFNNNSWFPRANTESHPCGCVVPQNGQPLCPCQMRSVEIRDGRYVRVQDLGPVAEAHEEIDDWYFDKQEPRPRQVS